MVVRNPKTNESTSGSRQIDVELAGGINTTATVVASGELLMDGEPLMPMGRTIRRSLWSNCWLKNHKPVIVQLSDEQQERIYQIIQEEGSDHIYPLVKGDIPYLRDSEARVLRDAISLVKSPSVSARKSTVRDKLLVKFKGQKAVQYIGMPSIEFIKWMNASSQNRELADMTMTTPEVTPAVIRELWRGSISSKEFTRKLDNLLLSFSEGGEEDARGQPHILKRKMSEDNHSEKHPDENDQEEPETKKVSFGSQEVKHFFCDECVDGNSEFEDLTITKDRKPLWHAMAMKRARERKEKTPDLEDMDEFTRHCMTHTPARKDCKVCQMTKKTLAPFVRGGATNQDSESIQDCEFLTFDWITPSHTASDGSRFGAIIGHVGRGCVFVKGYKEKADGVAVSALHEARCLWGIDTKRFVVHSDNEGVLKSEQMARYIQDQHQGRDGGSDFMYGVPRRSNSNCRAERFVRSGIEGVRALVYQAGIPSRWWPLAAHFLTIESARRSGMKPRYNTSKPVPFGTLGRALLPKGLSMNDKFDTKVRYVSYMGIDHRTSGGVKILFSDAAGKIKKGTIMARDVEWCMGEFAMERTRENLCEVTQWFEKCLALNGITENQACCDTCGKWRFIKDGLARQIQKSGFVCSDAGIKCRDKEDHRVWMTYDERDFDKFDEDIDDESDNPSDTVVDQEGHLKKAMKVKLFRASVLGNGNNPEVQDDLDLAVALVKSQACRVSMKDIDQLISDADQQRDASDEEVVKIFQMVVSAKEALNPSNPEVQGWLSGIDVEISSLFNEHGVLKLIDPRDLKPGDEIIPSMMILTLKSTGRKKARIVACGNFQKMPSQDAYCGVVGHDGWLQTFIIACKLGLTVSQVDVSTAFLQTDVCDDDPNRPRTILRPPKDVPQKPEEVGKLWEVRKSIYGLRSAPSAWKQTLVRWLSEVGYKPCPYDENIYSHPDGTLCLIYVDDLSFVGEDSKVRAAVKALQTRFKCTDAQYLGEASRDKPFEFLGHYLWIEQGHLKISQEPYAKSVVEKFSMSSCKPLATLRKDDFDREKLGDGDVLSPADQSKLRSIVGAVQYLGQGTRVDLCSPIAFVSEGQSNGSVKHLESGKKVVRYLAGNTGRHLSVPLKPVKKGGVIEIRVDFDASFGKSYARSGLAFYVDDALCWWQTRRQRCITLSTAEAELVSATSAGKECIGGRNFLRSVFGEDSFYKLRFEMRMRGDNIAANLISSRQASLRKVRHLSLSDLYIRQICQDENLQVEYVESTRNGSDCLTKVLEEQALEKLMPILCLENK